MAITHIVDGVVWNIQYDAVDSLLAVDIRRPEMLETTYTVIDLKTGAIIETPQSLKLPWDSALETCAHGLLVAVTFPRKNTPTAKGVFAWKPGTEEYAWQFPEAKLLAADEAGFILEEQEENLKRTYYVSAQSGARVFLDKETAKQKLDSAKVYEQKLEESVSRPLPTEHFAAHWARHSPNLAMDSARPNSACFLAFGDQDEAFGFNADPDDSAFISIKRKDKSRFIRLSGDAPAGELFFKAGGYLLYLPKKNALSIEKLQYQQSD